MYLYYVFTNDNVKLTEGPYCCKKKPIIINILFVEEKSRIPTIIFFQCLESTLLLQSFIDVYA